MFSKTCKKRSDIWRHFKEGAANKATCCYCRESVSYSGGSTGNLLRHMKRKHPTVPLCRAEGGIFSSTAAVSFPQTGSGESHDVHSHATASEDTPSSIRQLVVPTLSASTGSGESHGIRSNVTALEDTPSSSRQLVIPTLSAKSTGRQHSIVEYAQRPLGLKKTQMLDRQLLIMIVKEYQPFRIVEDKEFQKFITMLNPNYTLPSRKTISDSLLPRIYNEVHQVVENDLKDATAISLTTDGWTSINGDSFIGVTAHFINNNTQLSSYLLGILEYNEKHTSENLKVLMKKVTDEWGVDTKIISVTTDNAPNEVKLVQLCNWHRIPCFAHTVNLVVQNSVNTIKNCLISKVQNIVAYFKRSSFASNKLKEMQKQMNMPLLKLKQDVVTRWNSTFDMLCRFFKSKEPVIATLALINRDLNTLQEHDWEEIEQAVNILTIFDEITKEISSENCVTVSKILYFIKAMKTQVSHERYPDTVLMPKCKTLITEIRSQLIIRFGHFEDDSCICQATFLDPRFKKIGFINPNRYQDTLHEIKNQIREYTSTETVSYSDISVQDDPSTSTTSLLWEEFDKEVRKSASVSIDSSAMKEVDRYIEEIQIHRHEDPLKWWDERKLLYPYLYKIMKKRLCILATSVPCERLFSKTGQVLTDKRSRLKSSKISQIMFLNSNIRE